jgi:predicted RecA/RadA family phage recombinase
MSENEIYTKGSELVFPVHTSVTGGDFVQVGEIVGVAQNDAVTGEDGNTYATLKMDGVFAFTEAASGSTLAVGSPAYGSADGTTGVIAEVTSVSTDNKLVGHVTKLGTTQVHVRLVQSA